MIGTRGGVVRSSAKQLLGTQTPGSAFWPAWRSVGQPRPPGNLRGAEEGWPPPYQPERKPPPAEAALGPTSLLRVPCTRFILPGRPALDDEAHSPHSSTLGEAEPPGAQAGATTPTLWLGPYKEEPSTTSGAREF